MQTPSGRLSPAETEVRARRARAVRGALLLVFGLTEGALILLAFRIPYVTARLLVMVMGVFVVVDGAVALIEVMRTRNRSPWLLLHGLTGLVAGALVLVLARAWWLKVFAGWAILTGALAAVEAPRSLAVRVGVVALSLALGLLVLADAFRDPARGLLGISTYAVIAGSILLRTAWR